jgi:acyl-CoA reductase-like NAD-dependent aldehyde dehydrogenase
MNLKVKPFETESALSVMSYQTLNPATGALVKTFAPIDDRDLEGVLAIAHNAFEKDWRKRPVAERARIISKAASILREKADGYAQIITLEMGKRIMEAQDEVMLSARILEYYASPRYLRLPARAFLGRCLPPSTRKWRDAVVPRRRGPRDAAWLCKHARLSHRLWRVQWPDPALPA